MKKGDKRIRVGIYEISVDADGNKHKIKVGEKDIYETRPYAGVGAFNMSWDERNKLPRPNSLRQQKLRAEKAAK